MPVTTRFPLAALLAAAALLACGDNSSRADGGTDAADAGDARDSAPGDTVDATGTEDADVGDATDVLDDTTDTGTQDDADADGSGDVGSDVAADTDTTSPDTPDTDTDTGPAPLFDMDLIRDVSTIDCRFENHRTVLRGLATYDVWNVSFTSFEVIDGELNPIRIRAFAAKPTGVDSNLPGVANVHGLGGHATENMATGPAALLGYFAIAATGPGGGDPEDAATQSQGRPAGYDSSYRVFDVVTDPRGSWLWSHAVTAMRALTCLATRPEVDSSRLGMTGFSGGGIATLISASVDDRIGAAVPLSGTGGWRTSTLATNSWFHGLLTTAGLDTTTDEWTILTESIDPVALVGTAVAPIMMINGSTDEFFPLSSHVETYAAINPAVDKRTSIAANFDHGCYQLTGGESASAIEDRATLHSEGGQRLWFHHHFGTDSRYSYVPATPTVAVSNVGGATMVTVTADPGGSNLRIDEVRLWASGDQALTFGGENIDEVGGGVYSELVLVPYNDAAVWFADVTYRTRDLIGAEYFTLSSVPRLPAGHVPVVRSLLGEGGAGCLP